MSKNKLHRCFACFEGFGCNKEKLPRKKKKKMKEVYFALYPVTYRSWLDGMTSCDVASHYKHFKGRIDKFPFLKKYLIEIKFLINFYKPEEIYIDDDGRLSWYWECDSDYGGSSGLMPFEYSDAAAGDTWAFSELKTLVEYLDYYNIQNQDEFVFPADINSDKDLLEYIRKHNFLNIIKV